MSTLQRFVTVMALMLLVGFADSTLGQESGSGTGQDSAWLLEGLEQLESGDTDAARQTFLKIDVTKLASKLEREQLQDALRRLDHAPIRPKEPAPEPADEPQPAQEPEPQTDTEPVEPPTEPETWPEMEPEPEPEPQPPSISLMERAATLTAQQMVAEGDRAAEMGQNNTALKFYEDALGISPENEAAMRGREHILSLLGRQGRPRMLDEQDQLYRLKNEETISRYEEAMIKATESRTLGNYTLAVDYATQARAILDSGRNWLTQSEHTTRIKTVREFLLGVNEAAQAQEEREKAESLLKQQHERDADRLAAEQADEDKINELLRRAVALRSELRYDEALDVLEQAKFMDPNNTVVQALSEMIDFDSTQRNIRDQQKRRDRTVLRYSVENSEAAIGQTELITYPPDWPQISALRDRISTGSGASSTEKMIALGRLEQPIAVDWVDRPFVEAMQDIQEKTGVDMVTNVQAIEGEGGDPNTLLTLKLKSAPASLVISRALEMAGADVTPLSYNVDEGGIVTVSTVTNLSRKTIVRAYDINDLLHEIPDFGDAAPEFNLQQQQGQQTLGGGGGGNQGGGGQGLFGGGGAGGGAGGRGGGGGGGGRDRGGGGGSQTDTSRDDRVQEIIELIQSTIDPDSWPANGGTTGSLSELNGNLIIRTTDQNQSEVSNLLEQLRQQRAIMIHVETRLLIVDQNFLNEVGLDLDVKFDGLVDGLSPIVINNNTFDMTERSPTGLPGGFTLDDQGIDPFPPGPGEPETDGRSLGRGMAISGSYMNDIQVKFLIRATQGNRRAMTLTALRTTFFNGQTVSMGVANQVAYVSDIETEVGNNAVGLNPVISFASSGIRVRIQGTVSSDRKYVTLTIEPTLSTISQIRQVQQVLAVAGGQNTVINPDPDDPDTGLVSTTIEAPVQDQTILSTTVSVPDRGTLLLGGQRLWAEIEVEAGVPILSKIPFLNRLTTNRSKIKDERTLLILTKPTIMIQAEKEEELFPGSTTSPEAYPVAPVP